MEFDLTSLIITIFAAASLFSALVLTYPFKNRRVMASRDFRFWLGWSGARNNKRFQRRLERLLKHPGRIKFYRWRFEFLTILLGSGISLLSMNIWPLVFLGSISLASVLYGSLRKVSASESYVYWFGFCIVFSASAEISPQKRQAFLKAWMRHPDERIRLIAEIGSHFLPKQLMLENLGTKALPIESGAGNGTETIGSNKEILVGDEAGEQLKPIAEKSGLSLRESPKMPVVWANSDHFLLNMPMEKLLEMAAWVQLMPDVVCVHCKQHAQYVRPNPIPAVVCPNCGDSGYLIGPIHRLVGHLQEDYETCIVDGNLHFPVSKTPGYSDEKPQLLLLDKDFKENVNAALASYLEFLYNEENDQGKSLKIINQSGQEIDANLRKMLGERLLEG